MIIAAPIDRDGQVGHSWGKARTVAVASVVAGQLGEWAEFEVGWDRLHDEGTHGSHHARVVSFLRAHKVEVVAVDHVGDGMRRMLATMRIALVEGVRGPARDALVAVADRAMQSSEIPPGV